MRLQRSDQEASTFETLVLSMNVSADRLKWRPMPDKNAGIDVTP